MSENQAKPGPRWQPLTAVDRRVVGVLVEKAKTTPDAYPMSVNALSAGANQKNNRFPLMQLGPEDVEESLDRLRALGAVGEVQASGRVPKYRHYLYDWLGVDKVELAVMAELVLRGAQTEGELRGRAARMEPIADLAALRPVVDSLKAKGLVIPLSREGRGHVVAHALYEPHELAELRAEYGAGPAAPAPGPRVGGEAARAGDPPLEASASAGWRARPTTRVAGAANPPFEASEGVEGLRRELAELRDEVARLRHDFDELATGFQGRAVAFDHLKETHRGSAEHQPGQPAPPVEFEHLKEAQRGA